MNTFVKPKEITFTVMAVYLSLIAFSVVDNNYFYLSKQKLKNNFVKCKKYLHVSAIEPG